MNCFGYWYLRSVNHVCFCLCQLQSYMSLNKSMCKLVWRKILPSSLALWGNMFSFTYGTWICYFIVSHLEAKLFLNYTRYEQLYGEYLVFSKIFTVNSLPSVPLTYSPLLWANISHYATSWSNSESPFLWVALILLFSFPHVLNWF